MSKDQDKEKAVFEHLRYWEDQDHERIRQKLKDAGYDPDELAAEGKELAQSLISKARAKSRESASRLPEAAVRLADEMESQGFDVPEDLDKAIADILAGKMGEGSQQQLRAYWRNFEKATREDKIQILKDIRLLMALKQQKKPDDGKA